MEEKFEFRGDQKDIGLSTFLFIVLGFFSLGIATPWLYIKYRKSITEHIYFKGEKLRYDGYSSDFYQLFSTDYLLSIFTLGLSSVFGSFRARVFRYHLNHTILPSGERFETDESGLSVLGDLLRFRYGRPYPISFFPYWMTEGARQLFLSHVYIGNRPLVAAGDLYSYSKVILGNYFKTIITLGFYRALGFASVKVIEWDLNHTILPGKGYLPPELP